MLCFRSCVIVCMLLFKFAQAQAQAPLSCCFKSTIKNGALLIVCWVPKFTCVDHVYSELPVMQAEPHDASCAAPDPTNADQDGAPGGAEGDASDCDPGDASVGAPGGAQVWRPS